MIGEVNTGHHATILRLNQDFVHWLSPLDASALQTLLGRCGYARQMGMGRAVLLGYDGNSAYRHKNVDWLSARLGAYAYIDRIIVDPSLAGQGVARQLYADFESWARAQGLTALGCEVNTLPDNPASHAFHEKLGFKPIGEADYGTISVRYYSKSI